MALLACFVLAAAAAYVDPNEWVDPDTPKDQHRMERMGKKYKLVFSDEFDVEGRTFEDGHDPVWTGLDSPVFSNFQYNYYNSSLAWTKGGKLILPANNEDWFAPYDNTLVRHYQTQMLQTWNKMCFAEGFVEISAEMPGRHNVNGLWPGFWMMGNLGRATFKASTDNMWPFNYNECPDPIDHRAHQFGAQSISKCDTGQGRGAPEIDIIETMPGNFKYDYPGKIKKGVCGPADEQVLKRIQTTQPFVCTSLQAGPGQPKDALERPVLGCLPENFTANDGTTQKQYYDELYPYEENYGVIYGTDFDVAINYEFWGDEYYPEGKLMHTDAFSACTMLSATHFEEQHRWQMQWVAGHDGFMRFTLDDMLQFHVPAEVVERERPISFPDGKDAGTLYGRRIPEESHYLILNIDLAPRWGWKDCPKEQCNCCVDCKRSECTTCMVWEGDRWVNNREWLAELCDILPAQYEIDYIRVYQEEGKERIGCDPPDYPSAEYIHEHADRYTPLGKDEPLKAIMYGGQPCLQGDGECGDHGHCRPVVPPPTTNSTGICICDQGWVGPRCRSRSSGWATVCRQLSDDDLRGDPSAPTRCSPHEDADADTLLRLISMQCEKANHTDAFSACEDVGPGGRFRECSVRQRANHVLRTWSENMTKGVECCATLVYAGYCSRTVPEAPWLAFLLLVPLCWICCLAPCSRRVVRLKVRTAVARFCDACKTCYARAEGRRAGREASPMLAEGDLELDIKAPELSLIASVGPTVGVSKASLRQLRAIFADLVRIFGFQEDNATNQYDHLVTLWQSATRSFDDEVRGATQVHDTMFESFERWLDVSAGLFSFDRRRHVVFIKYRVPSHAQRLREMALFLCLWGEAGNLRFCPEVLCFFFECARRYTGALGQPPQDEGDAAQWEGADALPVHAGEQQAAPPADRRGSGFHARRRLSGPPQLLPLPGDEDGGASTAVDGGPTVINSPSPRSPFQLEFPPNMTGRLASLNSSPFVGSIKAVAGDDTAAGGSPSASSASEMASPRPLFFEMQQQSSRRSSLRKRAASGASRIATPLPTVLEPGAAASATRWNPLPGEKRRSLASANVQLSPRGAAPWLSQVASPARTRRLTADDDGVALGAILRDRAAAGRMSMVEVEEWAKHVRAAEDEPEDTLPAESVQPGAYMRNYVRPLYEYFFHFNFKGLSTKGVPIERPLDDGAARINYDDWNETFWTHERIRSIVTTDGESIIEMPKEERWDALKRVNWDKSLEHAQRHRAMHSWHNMYAAHARIVIFHLTTFYLLTILTLRLYVPDSMWLRPQSMLILQAGFLVPAVAQLVADFAKLHVLPKTTVVGTVLEPSKTLLYVVHVALFCSLAAHEGNRVLETLYYVQSALVLVRIVLVPGWAVAKVPEMDSNIYYPRGTLIPMSLFWLVVMAFKCFVEAVVVLRSVAIASVRLEIRRPIGKLLELAKVADLFFTRELFTRTCQQYLVWGTGMLVYMSTTYNWYIVGCCLFGTLRGMWITRLQGPRKEASRVPLRSLCDFPARFVAQIFGHDGDLDPRKMAGLVSSPMHPVLERKWAILWNAIVTSMLETDIIEVNDAKRLSYSGLDTWTSDAPFLQAPAIFTDEWFELPDSPEFRRRMAFMQASMRMRIPKAEAVERLPAFSVLIPHYGETIITSEKELFSVDAAAKAQGSNETLLGLLMEYYPSELHSFRGRMGEHRWQVMFEAVVDLLASNGEAKAAERVRRMSEVHARRDSTTSACSDYNEHGPPHFEFDATGVRERAAAVMELRKWASMRTQALWRTVRGMMFYETALDLLLMTQRPDLSAGEREAIVATKFQCIVSMQRYHFFDAEFLACTEAMFEVFPRLNVAYIEEANDGDAIGGKRFYSCLIDGMCEKTSDNRRVPRRRVELPGHPILGDGKGDNQNHAVIFAHGRILQTIDANQDGYLEEMLKVGNTLAEFRTDPTTSRSRVTILGFREHVYSAMGTIANFSATSEYVFGSLIQRCADRPLLSRMYYGHPDMMEKMTMMQQGGISKATKALNLSEDIFAGMDLCLRGGNVVHREYFQVGKGREMSFGGQLKFIAKLSRGTAEMTLTRQFFRLGSRLSFPRALGFWYGHVGFYATPVLMEMSIWCLVFTFTYFACVDAALTPVGAPELRSYASVASELLDAQFGPLTLLFLVSQALPLLFEKAINDGPIEGFKVIIKQFMTFSFMFFAFQSQLMGYNYRSEVSSGGAAYIATGRGLATTRQSYHPLYTGYALSNMQPGAELLNMAVLGMLARPVMLPDVTFWMCLSAISGSWLLSPFLFNPHMFKPGRILLGDAREWLGWVTSDKPDGWLPWQEGVNKALSSRPFSIFILPGRRFLAATALFFLQVDMPQNAPDVVDLLLFALPVIPVLTVAAAGPVVRRLPGLRKFVHAPLAIVLTAGYSAELVVCLFYGSWSGAFFRTVPGMAERRVVVIAAQRYFASNVVTSTFSWLLAPDVGLNQAPGEDASPCAALSGTAKRGVHTWMRDTVLAHALIADCWALLLVLVPSLAISLLPGVDWLHTFLLFHVMPASDLKGKVEKTTRQRADSVEGNHYRPSVNVNDLGSAANTPELLRRFRRGTACSEVPPDGAPITPDSALRGSYMSPTATGVGIFRSRSRQLRSSVSIRSTASPGRSKDEQLLALVPSVDSDASVVAHDHSPIDLRHDAGDGDGDAQPIPEAPEVSIGD